MSTKRGEGTIQWPEALRRAAAVAALVAVVAAQWLIGGRERAALGLLLAVPAVVVVVAALRCCRLRGDGARPGRVHAQAPLIAPGHWRLFCFASSLMLASFAFAGFGGNNLAGGLWYWLGAIVYFLLGTAARPAREGQRAPAELFAGVAVVAITLLGIAFRFYQLDALPPEMTSDHAEKLLDVHAVLGGWRPVFFPRNTGREMIQFYLTAAIIRLSGMPVGYLALKAGTALLGAITVPATYLLGRELYGRLAGLYAAFFLAVSHWHVAISRVGLRFPLTAAFATPALFFLLRALRENRRNDWLAAGLLLGLGLHGYTAMRVVPLLFVLLVLVKVGADVTARRRAGDGGEVTSLQARFWQNVGVAVMAASLAVLPLLRFALERPDLVWYRTATRALEGLAPGAVWPALRLNVKNALLMFNYRGDMVPANTLPEAPQLGLVSGGLFLAGTAYLVWRLLVCREWRAAYTLISFAVLLLPTILSLAYPEENPSAVRAAGAAPVVMVIAALPLAGLTALLWRRRRWRPLAAGLVGTLLLFAVVEDADWYFNSYRAHTLLSSWNASEMGAVARQFAAESGSLEQVYHVAYSHWVDTRNIGIEAGAVTWENAVLELKQIARHAEEPGPKLYFVFPDDVEALRTLRAIYPHGNLELYDSPRPGKDFFVFRVGTAE
ncbi:MAG: glycosyltransferase family 39 protein [Anaerolineae bacterium]|nr:glycosyltransferase family 39 protein [Anaerolineae bacterium]